MSIKISIIFKVKSFGQFYTNENFKINYPKYNLNTINAFTYYKTASC